MKKALITCSNSTIELYEFVEAFYLVSQKANTALELLRQGLPTWVSLEKYDEMKISLWVYNDTRANALCHYENGENYIALSVGLLTAFWNEVEDFVSQDNLTSVFKISEENRPTFMDNIYFYMLNFTIAHEYGHIAHGHLREQKGEKSIDETFRMSDVANDKDRKAKNWTTQLKEYDADSFAVTIQAVLFLQQWQEDIRVNLANFDKMFIANYLCFRTFAEKTGRKFADYFDKSIDEYDHPHPGIRMYYSYIHYSYWIGRFRDFGEDTMIILGSGSDAVISYEKNVLGKEKIKECYYSVAFTEKGAQHVMNLHNGWQEKIEHFNEYAYMEIEKMDTIDSMPVALDKNGNFVNKN